MAIWVNADEMRERLKWDFDDEYAESILGDVTSFCADMVEVVRCKDCVHYRHGTSCVCDLHSEEPDQYGRGFDMQMLLNDFCSYGERKGND